VPKVSKRQVKKNINVWRKWKQKQHVKHV